MPDRDALVLRRSRRRASPIPATRPASSTPTIAWLDRYVKGDESVDTGARVRLRRPERRRATRADDYPQPASERRSPRSGAGTLQLIAEGGAGPAVGLEGDGGLLGSLARPITPAQATNAVERRPSPRHRASGALVVGAPELTLHLLGHDAGGRATDAGLRPARRRRDRPRARQPDHADRGRRSTAKRTRLTVPLEMVAHFAATPGTTLTLQLVATTVAYAQPRLGGSVTFDEIDISLPVMKSATANAS